MKLVPVSPVKLSKVLGMIDYSAVRKKGSHVVLEHSVSGRILVVPVHSSREICVGLLSAILREAGLSRKEYFGLLERI